MICVKNNSTGRVARFIDKKARRMVHSMPIMYSFVSKSEWKAAGRHYSFSQ